MVAIFATGKAANNHAKITRAMYDDWLARFYPQQKELLEKTQNGELLKEQLSRVDGNFESSTQAAQQATQNQMGRFGLSAKEDPNSQSQMALAQATSKNSLREHEKDRAMSVLSGSGKSNLSQLEV